MTPNPGSDAAKEAGRRVHDDTKPWPCNCDDCSRRAWHSFMGYPPATEGCPVHDEREGE